MHTPVMGACLDDVKTQTLHFNSFLSTFCVTLLNPTKENYRSKEGGRSSLATTIIMSTASLTHDVELSFFLLVLLILVQLLEVGGVGAPQFHGSLGPHVDQPVGDGHNDRTYRVPLGRVNGRGGKRE